MSSKDELDTQPLIKEIWQAKKICYVPILSEGNALRFARYNQGDVLRENQFHIREPEKDTRKIVPEKLDLVIVPVMVFDVQGHRIGTGGGYFDRTFAFTHGENKKKQPVMLGYAFSEQRASSLPGDPWDVLLQGVVTEDGVEIY